MVAELKSLGFGRHVYEEILHSLHTRQDNREQAMADALTVLQDMLRNVRSHDLLTLTPPLPPSPHRV